MAGITANKKKEKPSQSLYSALHSAYMYFNEALFGGQLPEVMFTVQRQRGMMGYFSPDRWASLDGELCHEIAINPYYIGRSRLLDVLDTLAHESTHVWQHSFGSPGRRGYHNREWADKMIEIGLQPSSTGFPGGDITGEKMSDYPIKGGAFLKAANHLVGELEYTLPWLDRVTAKPLQEIEVAEHLEHDLPIETIEAELDYLDDVEALLLNNFDNLLPAELSSHLRALTEAKQNTPARRAM